MPEKSTKTQGNLYEILKLQINNYGWVALIVNYNLFTENYDYSEKKILESCVEEIKKDWQVFEDYSEELIYKTLEELSEDEDVKTCPKDLKDFLSRDPKPSIN